MQQHSPQVQLQHRLVHAAVAEARGQVLKCAQHVPQLLRRSGEVEGEPLGWAAALMLGAIGNPAAALMLGALGAHAASRPVGGWQPSVGMGNGLMPALLPSCTRTHDD